MEGIRTVFTHKWAKNLVRYALLNGPVRRALLKPTARSLTHGYRRPTPYKPPPRVVEDKYRIVLALLKSVDRGLSSGYLSRDYWNKLFDSFVGIFARGRERVEAFKKRYNLEPPGFITISPTDKCNLKCEGCYASSSSAGHSKLSYETLTRIVREQKELWGSHFTVISGGEPFIYRDGGKTILDLAEEHPDTFFQVFTNGILITDEVAAKLAEAANVTPAISVEGFAEETDQRRGKGVHERILRGMKALRSHGVPFGVSVTVTSRNIDVLLGDAFWDYYLDEQGALYAWVFQYMPVGRAYTLDLMITPEERMKLYHHVWRQVKEKERFLADFWNCGTVSTGCISAGVHGGYLHILWDGKVTPCVFNPYATDNINDVYARGDNLDSILFSPYFEGIRKWQRAYVYDREPGEMGNVIAPCPYRDHYEVIFDLIQETRPEPQDKAAAEALQDEEYRKGLIGYGNQFATVADPFWEKEYLSGYAEEPNASEPGSHGGPKYLAKTMHAVDRARRRLLSHLRSFLS